MIPCAIPLLGHRITVGIVPPEQWPYGEDCVGIWLPADHTIHIVGGQSDSVLMQTFMHELLHAALDLMNHKLSRNEVFVDTLAGLLAQALTGAEYEAPKKRRVTKRRTKGA